MPPATRRAVAPLRRRVETAEEPYRRRPPSMATGRRTSRGERRTSMEGSPPYLFGTDDHPGAGLRVTGDIDAAAIEITVRGRWSQRLGLDAYAVIRKCLTEQPSAIIVDLVGLDDPFAASATMWLAVNRTAGRLDPPARVVLCLPPATPLAGKLRRLGAARFVALFATMPQARAALRRDLPLT